MNINIVTPNDYKHSHWSGGTTTELYIAPQSASYQQRNFDIRISSAKVLLESSDFTHLPGVHRLLMPLDNSLQVFHKGHHEKLLQPFTVDTFEGDWKTHSVGACTDFNVMTTSDKEASLSSIVTSKEHLEINLNKNTKQVFLYAFDNDILLNINRQEYHLIQNHLMAIEDLENHEMICSSEQNAHLIIVEI